MRIRRGYGLYIPLQASLRALQDLFSNISDESFRLHPWERTTLPYLGVIYRQKAALYARRGAKRGEPVNSPPMAQA
jgi:hypothetical protein